MGWGDGTPGWGASFLRFLSSEAVAVDVEKMVGVDERVLWNPKRGGIYLNAEPSCLNRLGEIIVLPIEPVLGSCFHITVWRVPDKCLEPRMGAKSWLYREWLQTRCNSTVLREVWVLLCRRMTPSLNMPGRLRRKASRWPSEYFLFQKLKEPGIRRVIH
ncbi:hypothetical protein AVEN_41854-1 [Araneus ventricosus]|uniref:Uncharacterized protein n=1 Tax=Araneus ventricosus TaxID=182803 RepID=A0A4Y2ACZ4_ARAVE|nr:hypothetical protein AVEN_41854-1 [Araneus ventricosus]